MIPLPAYIDPEAWDGYVEMRRAIKKPLTKRAAVSLLCNLQELKDKGHDVNAALDQSTFCCWRGVFPAKDRCIERAPETKEQYAARERAERQAEKARAAPMPDEVRAKLATLRRVA
jgi:hypothetical protein